MARRCSQCSNNGHNSRTCPGRSGCSGVKLFGVRLTEGVEAMKKSASMGSLSSAPSSDPVRDHAAAADGYASDDTMHASCSSNCRNERKKGQFQGEVESRPSLIVDYLELATGTPHKKSSGTSTSPTSLTQPTASGSKSPPILPSMKRPRVAPSAPRFTRSPTRRRNPPQASSKVAATATFEENFDLPIGACIGERVSDVRGKGVVADPDESSSAIPLAFTARGEESTTVNPICVDRINRKIIVDQTANPCPDILGSSDVASQLGIAIHSDRLAQELRDQVPVMRLPQAAMHSMAMSWQVVHELHRYTLILQDSLADKDKLLEQQARELTSVKATACSLVEDLRTARAECQGWRSAADRSEVTAAALRAENE